MRIVFVTGGTRGIGRAIVSRFVESGCFVYFSFRKNLEIADEIEKTYGKDKVKAVQTSSDTYEEAEKIIASIIEEKGKIDILVNNAGINQDNYFAMMKFEDFRNVIETNLMMTAAFCRAAIRPMMTQKNGVIINLSSISGITGSEGQANYAASKAGIIALTKSMAREVGKYPVRVVGIAPGFIETDMYAKIPIMQRKKMVEGVALKRPGRPEEIADTVEFLASEKASYITGTTIVVDGGLI